MAKLTPKDELNLIADWKTGRYSQRDLASKYVCSKGKVSQLTEGIEKAKNDHLVNAQISLLSARAYLSDEEMTAIMTTAQNEVYNLGLVTNATQLNLIRTNQYLAKNEKVEIVKLNTYTDGRLDGQVVDLVKVGLGADDFKYCQDTIDKASITLGINQRHSNSQVNIQNTNNQSNVITATKEDISKVLLEFDNEY